MNSNIIEHSLSACCMPGSVLRALCELFHFILLAQGSCLQDLMLDDLR